MRIQTTINGVATEADVEPRTLLVDLLRDQLGLTGTHIGCEEGVCGACTVTVDGEITKACMLLAVQADGAEVETVEGLADGAELSPLQVVFSREHGLQCGYCTPGFLMAARELLARNPNPTEDDVRAGLAGNICRCTGYTNIVRAVMAAASEGVAVVHVNGNGSSEAVPVRDAVAAAVGEPGPEAGGLESIAGSEREERA